MDPHLIRPAHRGQRQVLLDVKDQDKTPGTLIDLVRRYGELASRITVTIRREVAICAGQNARLGC
jgi:hypothetical protein